MKIINAIIIWFLFSPTQTERVIQLLGHDEYKVRESATAYLMLNPCPTAAYFAEYDDLEISRRLERIISSRQLTFVEARK